MARIKKKIWEEEKKECICNNGSFSSTFGTFFITGRNQFSSGPKHKFFSDMFFINTLYESAKRGLLLGSLVSESGAKGGSKWSGFSEVVKMESKRKRRNANLTVRVKAGKFNFSD